jgi:hypothetical protein
VIPSQTVAATSDAATPTQTPDEILSPVGPEGGYGSLGSRRLGVRQDSAPPTVIQGSYGVLNALAKRMGREGAI